MAESVRDMTTAIASGDTEAFARFYESWFDVAFGEARRIAGGDEEFCLDVVQEAMMRVIRSIKPIDDEAGLRRWLRVVVQSCCYDALRRRKRRRAHETSAATELSTGQHNLPIDDQLAWLRAQLAALRADEAHLLTLRFRFGWTLHRIGRFMGLKPGAVDGRIGRTLAGLRQQARKDGHD